MAFNIDSIKRGLKLGGARPNLFDVTFNAPIGVPGVNFDATPLLVQAASIPEASMGVIPVPYFGRTMKLAGDRQFQPWSVSVLNDEDFKIRDGLEKWSNAMNGFFSNVRDPAMAGFNYKAVDATVSQYGKTGNIIRTYKFHGIWPVNIEQIALNWGETDTIESFGVMFEYDWWSVEGGIGSETAVG